MGQTVKGRSTALADRLRALTDSLRRGTAAGLSQAAKRRNSGNKESDQDLHDPLATRDVWDNVRECARSASVRPDLVRRAQ
jgi:hypothetical protein